MQHSPAVRKDAAEDDRLTPDQVQPPVTLDAATRCHAFDLWRQVVSAAGFRCQCAGQCGDAKDYVKGRKAPARITGQCVREHLPHAPLHAVPAMPARPVSEMQLTAAELVALCDRCHGGLQAVRQRQERAATAERQASDQGTLW